jgi:hypothetical protein
MLVRASVAGRLGKNEHPARFFDLLMEDLRRMHWIVLESTQPFGSEFPIDRVFSFVEKLARSVEQARCSEIVSRRRRHGLPQRLMPRYVIRITRIVEAVPPKDRVPEQSNGNSPNDAKTVSAMNHMRIGNNLLRTKEYEHR